MMRKDFTDATTLRAYVQALPKFQRDAYLAENAAYKTIDGDLTDAEWRRYAELRRARGTGAAHAFASAVRRAAWSPVVALGVDDGSPMATFYKLLGCVLLGVAGILGAACLLYLY